MRFFLKARAWQLFLLLFGSVVLWPYLMVVSIESQAEVRIAAWATIVPTIVLMGCFTAWLWVLGTALSSRIPEELRVKQGLFRFGLAYVLLFWAVSSVLMAITLSKFSKITPDNPPDPELFYGFVVGFNVILPFHLLAMFFSFYAVYFVAKHLAMAERQEKVTFYDYSGPFFLLWFFPIGVWVIQPRINRMFQSGDTILYS